MRELLFLGISAFLFCLFFTPLCRDLFVRHGIVDYPDDNRKLHLHAVPRIGGVPIALAYGAALILLFSFNPGGGKIYIQHDQLFHALLPAAALIFATGLVDDIYGLRPWQKLAGQLAAATLAVFLGVRLEYFPTHPSISIAISIIWLVGCTNAVNLIDGMDGLATGIGLLATMTTILVALLSGNYGLALATFPLAGCLLGFLPYNFSPATVFLGDCGSLTIGFVLGCFGLIWSQRSESWIGMFAPLMVLALPLIDVGLAICRRFLRCTPIFQGDHNHIHHKVLGLGFCTRDAALIRNTLPRRTALDHLHPLLLSHATRDQPSRLR
jgi:UDP-GlcNAc:undecaprenyl-phosphate GlcNAc-1-phosphate transferase